MKAFINHQSSLPLESIIRINLVGNLPKNCSYETNKDNSISTTFSVKLTDPTSKIFDLLGTHSREARLIFNGQVLCPTLTFAFYSIHNNDKLVIIPTPNSISASQSLEQNIPLKNHNSQNQVTVAIPKPVSISHKRTLFYSTCSNLYKKYTADNNNNDNQPKLNESIRRIPNIPTGKEQSRLADMRMSKIESNQQSYRKLCSKYNSFANDHTPNSSQALFDSPEIEELRELREENDSSEKLDLSTN